MKKVLDELERLIVEGADLRERGRGVNTMDDRTREDYFAAHTRWVRTGLQVLSFANLTEYERQLKDVEASKPYPAYKCAQLVAVLEAARDAIKAGFLGKITYLYVRQTKMPVQRNGSGGRGIQNRER